MLLIGRDDRDHMISTPDKRLLHKGICLDASMGGQNGVSRMLLIRRALRRYRADGRGL